MRGLYLPAGLLLLVGGLLVFQLLFLLLGGLAGIGLLFGLLDTPGSLSLLPLQLNVLVKLHRFKNFSGIPFHCWTWEASCNVIFCRSETYFWMNKENG